MVFSSIEEIDQEIMINDACLRDAYGKRKRDLVARAKKLNRIRKKMIREQEKKNNG